MEVAEAIQKAKSFLPILSLSFNILNPTAPIEALFSTNVWLKLFYINYFKEEIKQNCGQQVLNVWFQMRLKYMS